MTLVYSISKVSIVFKHFTVNKCVLASISHSVEAIGLFLLYLSHGEIIFLRLGLRRWRHEPERHARRRLPSVIPARDVIAEFVFPSVPERLEHLHHVHLPYLQGPPYDRRILGDLDGEGSRAQEDANWQCTAS